MEICTALSPDQVLERCRRGRLGPYSFTSISQSNSGRWGGKWDYGVFSIRTLDEEDRDELAKQFGLPPTLQTKLWFACDQMYEGQTEIYRMAAVMLEQWPGDLAVLNYGDGLRVQRIDGQICLREDCLNPERLVFYQGFHWKPLPIVEE